MAFGSTVPPRAYTRDMLTTAFNWLQSQPDSVRSRATTPDALVAMYMQFKRGGAAPTAFETEAPVSAQVFMSDLKNLAEGLKEFDDSRSTKAVNPPSSSRAQAGQSQTYPQAQAAQLPTQEMMAPTAAPYSVASAPLASEAQAAPTPPKVAESATQAAPGVSAVPGLSLTSGLNDRSIQMLREVQAALNLTSDAETLNMMIALAHKSLNSLLA